jgi:hypothetical protein
MAVSRVVGSKKWTLADIDPQLVSDLMQMHFNPSSWWDEYSVSAWLVKYGDEQIAAASQLVLEPCRRERAALQKRLDAVNLRWIRKVREARERAINCRAKNAAVK